MAAKTEQRQDETERTESSLLTEDGARHWSAWLAAVVVVGTFSISHGFSGLLAGLVTAAVWAALGTPTAIAAGTVLLIAQTPDGVDPLGAAVVASGLLALVVAPAVTARYSVGYAAVAILTTAAFGALAWLVLDPLALWLATAVVAGATLLAAYGLHRYLHLRLGILDEEQTASTNDQAEGSS